MALLDEIYTMAAVFLAPDGDEAATALRTCCMASLRALEDRLRPGVTVEDCRESFICAAAWMALCGFETGLDADGVRSASAGDVSVTRSPTADALRTQAELIMAPYIGDSFVFAGVRG
jgi:hypothetical protein